MKSAISKRPTEAFGEILKVARFCAGVVGADIAAENYRMSFMTFVTFSLIVLYFIFTIMTIIETFAENWMFALEATCMISSVLQGCVKLISSILKEKTFTEIRLLLEQLYEEYEKKGPQYCAALNRCSLSVRRVIIMVGVIYLLSALAMLLVPLLILATSGRRYLIMHFLLPGLDVGTNFGYFATLALHSSCVLAGGFGLFAGDIFVLVYLTQSFFFVEVFQLKVKEFNELVEIEENRTRVQTFKSLVDLVQWHQLYMRYTKVNNSTLLYIVSVQVATSGISIVITIFIFLTSDWPGAFPYLIVTFLSLYLYCILGTKIETCNDQFCYEIYNISWYNLKARQQKIVRLMLMQSQSPNVITVAGCMSLTVSTALQITKTISSITMMMVQFLH